MLIYHFAKKSSGFVPIQNLFILFFSYMNLFFGKFIFVPLPSITHMASFTILFSLYSFLNDLLKRDLDRINLILITFYIFCKLKLFIVMVSRICYDEKKH